MNIYLLRHGESEQNVDKKKFFENDKEIKLTQKGIEQAKKAGEFLKTLIFHYDKNLTKTYILSSDFVRAMETAQYALGDLPLKINISSDLSEYKRGIFGKYPLEEAEKLFPKEFKEFAEGLKGPNKFYAKQPEGESASDVVLRVKKLFPLFEQLEKQGVENLILVSHSGTIRCLTIAFMGYGPEWYANEKNMINCSIRLIVKENENFTDKNYIYGGYKHSSSGEIVKNAIDSIKNENNKSNEINKSSKTCQEDEDIVASNLL